MVHHEKFLRDIEACHHGEMTAQERSDKVGKILENWIVELEEEHNLPFGEIPINSLPPVNRTRVLNFVRGVFNQNRAGKRSGVMEAYCEGSRDACQTITAQIISGRLE